MEPAELLTRLGGIGAADELKLCRRRVLRAAEADGTIVKVARGQYALPGVSEAEAAARRTGGVISHLSAAQRHGWKLKFVPEQPIVTVPRNRNLTAAQREGLEVRWHNLHPDDVKDGVTSKVRTVTDIARTEPFDVGLTVADSAVRNGDVTQTQMVVEANACPRTGRPAAMRVTLAVDGRAANPFESVLRAIALEVPGLRVVPQQWVGRVGRVDLLDEHLNLVIEADSWEFHGERCAFVGDIRRYTRFARLGFAVVRFTWEEVMLTRSTSARC